MKVAYAHVRAHQLYDRMSLGHERMGDPAVLGLGAPKPNR
jgi:hypothetical protein